MSIDIKILSGEKKKNCRLKIWIQGAVQGVGFRPFIYRLATQLKIPGWVSNSAQGVVIELEGNIETLNEFLTRAQTESPPHSLIKSVKYEIADTVGYDGFTIKESELSGEKTALVLPDIAVCSDCLHDIFDPNNRRYQYPFTNCTNCGPRYSIIEALPYDRSNTTMKTFTMCDECRSEYEDPLNRRFHAQPNACPNCGPRLELWDKNGSILASHNEALLNACDAIRNGEIIALKGLGGFQLIVDVRNEQAVARLRYKKARMEKPFALMYPDSDTAASDCETSALERQLLSSPESPILLLRRKHNAAESPADVSALAAPNNPYLGIMLPYTPLHHLLMAELRFPVVATSGNFSDEPLCIDNHEALSRLGSIADIFLVHNRPIVNHVDDSIVRVMMGRELILRRARGYAPLPIPLTDKIPPRLAVGAHQKNSIAISIGNQAFISQHIGDLENSQSCNTFKNVIRSLANLYDFTPTTIVCDKHPDYYSSSYISDMNIPQLKVQHHYAHALSCLIDNDIEGPALGVVWDGTGYGLNGTIWGSEFLTISKDSFSRTAHLRTFRLPGNEKAINEPRRSALGLLYEIFGDNIFDDRKHIIADAFNQNELKILRKMLERKINAPVASSAGRLFDAVSFILKLGPRISFEGQAAMKLEFEAEKYGTNDAYKFALKKQNESYIIDWEPMILEIIDDLDNLKPTGEISRIFHNTLTEMIIAIAANTGEKKVLLTGGCFQNKYLTERTIARLIESGFQPYWHHLIPPNDGGICLGQLAASLNIK